MQCKIGRIIKYDNCTGTIITEEGQYIFKKQDAEKEIKNGDLVKFRPETKNNQKMAFFVKRIFKNGIE